MTSHAEVLPVYRRFRQIGLQLNHKLVKTLSTEALNEGGRRLGILKNDTFVFDSEDETSVLMDYCIHNVRDRRHERGSAIHGAFAAPGRFR